MQDLPGEACVQELGYFFFNIPMPLLSNRLKHCLTGLASAQILRECSMISFGIPGMS
jgi:hypothetical protein